MTCIGCGPTCVFDFSTNDKRMSVVSVHPGVEIEQISENTEFDLEISESLGESRLPTQAEMEIIEIDPKGLRYLEVIVSKYT